MIKDFFSSKNWGIFLVRVVLGAVFIVHGLEKIQNIDGVIGFFGSLGLPALLAYVVAWSEFVGGIVVLLGIFHYRKAAYLLALIMVGAIYLVKFNKGFSGGYEFDLLLLVSALAVASAKDMPYLLSGRR